MREHAAVTAHAASRSGGAGGPAAAALGPHASGSPAGTARSPHRSVAAAGPSAASGSGAAVAGSAGGRGGAEGLSLGAAVARIREGLLIAYPTETVYGIGADATSEPAMDRLRRFKARGPGFPISILVTGAAALEPLGFEVPPAARRLADAFWPGPVTLVLPCRRTFATGVARSDGAVGVRCARHPAAEALARCLEQAGAGPITATSLNRSGRPAARTREQARSLCSADPDTPQLLHDDTPEAPGAPESTVVDLTAPDPVILRPGALPPEALTAALAGSREGRCRGGRW